MMKAVRVEQFGTPNVLQLQTVELPVISETKVLVKIKAAGVNPVDTYIRSGSFQKLPDLPYTPGKDGAGIVEAIGSKVTRLKVGQRVFVCDRSYGRYGTYAEYALVKEDDVFLLDDRLTFEEGAAVGIPYFTAFRALVSKGKCQAGQTVLIHGASGAVGLASVQIAKNRGLNVIGTAGTPEGMAVVKSCGADFVICHREPNYLEKVMEITKQLGVNIIIEMLSNVNFDKDLDILAPSGRLLIVGSRGTVNINPRKFMRAELEAIGVALYCSTKDEWEEMSEEIVKGIQNGWLKPVIDKIYPLDKASEAHEDIIRSSGARGKLILSVSGI